jgi:hypothetical protein
VFALAVEERPETHRGGLGHRGGGRETAVPTVEGAGGGGGGGDADGWLGGAADGASGGGESLLAGLADALDLYEKGRDKLARKERKDRK